VTNISKHSGQSTNSIKTLLMNYNSGIIIQARTASTRLPKKIILKIDNKTTFLDVLLSRFMQLKKDFPIVVATSNNPDDDVIVEFGNKYKIPVYRGSEQNVLERFVKCAEFHRFDTIIRVCSDNPFIDIQSIIELYKNYRGEDYLSYKINEKPSILTHYGFFAEIISLQALKKVFNSGESQCIEHVSNCIYSSESDFNVRFIAKNIPNQNIRCTLDTKDDFENLKQIYFNWFKKKKNSNFGYLDLIEYIESNPDLVEKMKKQIISNSK